MARKNHVAEMHEAMTEGVGLEPTPDVNELDKEEVQRAILEPGTIDIKLKGDKTVSIRRDLGPAQLKRHAIDNLRALTELLTLETAKLSGDFNAQSGDWIKRNMIYFQMASRRLNVRMMNIETINSLNNTAYVEADFVSESLDDAALGLMVLYLNHITEVTKNSKN